MASISATIKSNKRLLRKTVASTLKAIPPATVEEQSNAITERILSMPSFKDSRSISCYLSMPTGEVNTSNLVVEILRAGKTLFVPRIDQTADKMDFLQIYGEDDLLNLPSGVWGIKEPLNTYNGKARLNVLDGQCEGLDMILMPGVAFDRSLSRLGHGKGYYDRFIASYNASGRKRPHLVALALKEQIVETVPITDYDWPVNAVATPDELITSPIGGA